MRVRVVLGAALALVIGGLVLDMSGTAPRTAGSDQRIPAIFVAVVPGGSSVCQPTVPPDGDAARAVLTLGSYGKPIPAVELQLLGPGGTVSASGTLAAGSAREGVVSIPLRHARGAPPATQLCLHVAGRRRAAFAGEGVPVSSAVARIGGTPVAGIVSVSYYRAGTESWWQLLGTLSSRFGRGKAAIFGDWTLALCALALLALWIAAVRLLARESA